MAPESGQEGVGLVVGPAFEVHLAVGVMEEGEHIEGPVTDILEFLEPLAHPVGLQIRRQPLEDLDTRTLVNLETAVEPQISQIDADFSTGCHQSWLHPLGVSAACFKLLIFLSLICVNLRHLRFIGSKKIRFAGGLR